MSTIHWNDDVKERRVVTTEGDVLWHPFMTMDCPKCGEKDWYPAYNDNWCWMPEDPNAKCKHCGWRLLEPFKGYDNLLDKQKGYYTL